MNLLNWCFFLDLCQTKFAEEPYSLENRNNLLSFPSIHRAHCNPTPASPKKFIFLCIFSMIFVYSEHEDNSTPYIVFSRRFEYKIKGNNNAECL